MNLFQIIVFNIRVRDSRTGYLLPVRVALWDLPGWMSCWHVAAVAAAVVILINTIVYSL